MFKALTAIAMQAAVFMHVLMDGEITEVIFIRTVIMGHFTTPG